MKQTQETLAQKVADCMAQEGREMAHFKQDTSQCFKTLQLDRQQQSHQLQQDNQKLHQSKAQLKESQEALSQKVFSLNNIMQRAEFGQPQKCKLHPHNQNLPGAVLAKVERSFHWIIVMTW